jgi:hypothetical protein
MQTVQTLVRYYSQSSRMKLVLMQSVRKTEQSTITNSEEWHYVVQIICIFPCETHRRKIMDRGHYVSKQRNKHTPHQATELRQKHNLQHNTYASESTQDITCSTRHMHAIWIKYNQHKTQHAAHNKHGSSRMNQYNKDHATHEYRLRRQNKTKHTAHNTQRSSRVDTVHKRYRPSSMHKTQHTKFIKNTEYWSQPIGSCPGLFSPRVKKNLTPTCQIS